MIAPRLIEEVPPANWRVLQDQACQILGECGFDAKTTTTVTLARGQAEIDVYAEDKKQTPNMLVFCECKHWKSAIPQSVVHAFRTIVADGGANIGYLICTSSLQSGAREAARNSNVRPVTWEQFQHLYADRWFERFFFPVFHKTSDRLAGYSEQPLPSIRFIPEHLREAFWTRFDRDYAGVGVLGLHTNTLKMDAERHGLPLRQVFFDWVGKKQAEIPDYLFAKKSLRGWLDGLLRRVQDGYNFVDAFFKEHNLEPGRPP